MLDITEGIRDLFLDAQGPVIDAARLGFCERIIWFQDRMMDRTRTYRAKHPERRRASDKAYNDARKESRRAYDRARHLRAKCAA